MAPVTLSGAWPYREPGPGEANAGPPDAIGGGRARLIPCLPSLLPRRLAIATICIPSVARIAIAISTALPRHRP